MHRTRRWSRRSQGTCTGRAQCIAGKKTQWGCSRIPRWRPTRALHAGASKCVHSMHAGTYMPTLAHTAYTRAPAASSVRCSLAAPTSTADCQVRARPRSPAHLCLRAAARAHANHVPECDEVVHIAAGRQEAGAWGCMSAPALRCSHTGSTNTPHNAERQQNHPALLTNVDPTPSDVKEHTSDAAASRRPHAAQQSASMRRRRPASRRSRSAAHGALSSSWRVPGCSGRF